jgi:hypothetical protein
VGRVIAASNAHEILDVGCGTGIAARLFASAGCRVLGIDPDARMAQIARESGVEVQVARFEDWEADARRFDAVISAQAWHWVDPVAGAVKAASVLRPGGRLAVFWNVFDPPARLRAAFGRVYHRTLPDSPLRHFWSMPALTAHQMMSGTATTGIRQAGMFGPPEQWRFDWSRPCTREEWLDMVPTLGYHGEFPSAVLAELLAGLGAAIDAAGGTFVMRYTTVAVTAAVAGAVVLRASPGPSARGEERYQVEALGDSAARRRRGRAVLPVQFAQHPRGGLSNRGFPRLQFRPSPVTARVHLEKDKRSRLEKEIERSVAQGQAFREQPRRRDDRRREVRPPDPHPVGREPWVRSGLLADLESVHLPVDVVNPQLSVVLDIFLNDHGRTWARQGAQLQGIGGDREHAAEPPR